MLVRKLIAAHRGDRSRAHENTLEAVHYAIESGADMIEFDVRQTADGELVVHHDEAIGNWRLRSMAYADAQRASAALGYEIPRLTDVLAATSGRILLDVELKEAGYEESVIRLLFDSRFNTSDFVITSFEEPALHAIRQSSPGIRIGLLVYDVTGAQAFEMFERSGADFLGPDYTILDGATLRNANASRVDLFPWTVNDANAVRSLLAEPSVLGIITDDPRAALRLRRESEHARR